MLSYSSRRRRRKRLFLIYIPLVLSIFITGILVIGYIEDLKPETVSFTGFDGISYLEKIEIDSSSLTNIDEKEVIKLTEKNEPEAPPVSVPDTEPPVPEDEGYRVLKETATVGDDYFSDTLFIGDSRMVGLGMTAEKNCDATFYAAVAMSVNQLGTKEVIKVDEETSHTIMGAIENNEKNFKRTYMMFGLNELGWKRPSVFISSMKTAIDQIRELKPNTEICIMAIMPVTSDAVTLTYSSGIEANKKIREYNSLLLELASESGCWYLDTYSLFADTEGNMPKDFTPDGIHIYSKHNKTLMNYISTHAFAY